MNPGAPSRGPRRFTPSVLTLVPVGVALNLSLGTLAQIAKVPLYLDSIGTVVVAVLCGPAAAVATALITVFVGGVVVNPVMPWYSATAVVIGVYSGVVANRGAFRRLWTTAVAGLGLGVLTAVVSAPVTVYLFGGITPAGSSVVVAYLMATGEAALKAVVLTGFACDPVDKCLTFLIALVLVRGMPVRLRAQFPRGLANTAAVPPPGAGT